LGKRFGENDLSGSIDQLAAAVKPRTVQTVGRNFGQMAARGTPNKAMKALQYGGKLRVQ
jgi:hypothetical protein